MHEPIMNDRLVRFHQAKKTVLQQLVEDDRYISARNPQGCVPLISIEHDAMSEHKGGVFFEATIPVAAKMLAKKTHRLATEQEHNDFLRTRDHNDTTNTEPDQKATPTAKTAPRPKNGSGKPGDPAEL
jgi:hypothetical protein